jgi:hypothetical protein
VAALMRKVIAFAFVGLAAACAQIQPVVAPTTPPDPNAAYITGTFTRASMRGFAFAIRNQDGKEYFMSLGEDRNAPTNVEDQTVAIQVPPGTYAVMHWVAYDTSTKAVEMRRPVDNAVLARAFTARAGEVVHLGEFDVQQARRADVSYYSIKPAYIATKDEARATVAKAYPNLALRPFQCLVCR